MLTFEVEILGLEAAPGELSLSEQIEQAQALLADDLDRVRQQGERRIEDLKAQLEASGGSSATVGGDAAPEPKREPQYD